MGAPTDAQPPFGDYSEYETPNRETDNSTTDSAPNQRYDRLPKQRIELVVIDGDEGQRLHALQSDAVYDALLWLANHRRTTSPPEAHA